MIADIVYILDQITVRGLWEGAPTMAIALMIPLLHVMFFLSPGWDCDCRVARAPWSRRRLPEGADMLRPTDGNSGCEGAPEPRVL
jgi:hypothetical protein